MKKHYNSGENNGNWAGDNVSKVGMHRWLRDNYRIKKHCQNKYCDKTSKNLDFALRKGFNYERKIDNYVVLCRSCHKKYDSNMRDKERSKIIVSLRDIGFTWFKIGEILNMDFRNVARAYKKINFKIEITENIKVPQC